MRILKTTDMGEEMTCYTKQEIAVREIVIWSAIIISFILGYVVGRT